MSYETGTHETVIEHNDFYNDGFGWVCRHCERLAPKSKDDDRSRLLIEGEAESRNPQLSNRALAKWADAAQRTLVCPKCGITELIDIA